MVDVRVTYRRRHAYNTASNKTRILRTPGGRVVVQYRKKTAKGPHTPSLGAGGSKRLAGIKSLRPRHYSQLSKRQKTVKRAYGGVLSADEVRERIIRAFLVEEQKIVKMFYKQSKMNKPAKRTKNADKKTKKSKKSK